LPPVADQSFELAGNQDQASPTTVDGVLATPRRTAVVLNLANHTAWVMWWFGIMGDATGEVGSSNADNGGLSLRPHGGAAFFNRSNVHVEAM